MAAARRPIRAFKVVALSRNFGTSGADGRLITPAARDRDDRRRLRIAELIPEMTRALGEGVDVVYAVREERRGETVFKKTTARWFYRVFRRMTTGLAVESGDFR